MAAWIVAMLSSSFAAPYIPDIPMQPSPRGKTSGPVAPSRRVLVEGLMPIERARSGPTRSRDAPEHEITDDARGGRCAQDREFRGVQHRDIREREPADAE